jgi:hypothetical protein
MAEARVYIDESQAPSAEGTEAGQPFRVGALVVEHESPRSVPTARMARLRPDPDARWGSRCSARRLRVAPART